MEHETDAAVGGWAIGDGVVDLRRWGSPISYWLPKPPIQEWTVGSAETCGLQLTDRSGYVSRLHARLVRHQAGWLLRDEGSKNGVWVDGLRRKAVMLTPGLEIRIGSVTLIADSARLNDLRSFLARLLGWSGEHMEVVDQALRAVRIAATGRGPLVLCGDDDLAPIARGIHRHARGSERPFIVCDPLQQAGRATARSSESYDTGMAALAAAAGGSLCVRRRRPPSDFSRVMQRLREPTSQVQLIMCVETLEECKGYPVAPIVIPPLADREDDDIHRIIYEFAHDAMVELATSRSIFESIDHAWVRAHATSLPEIVKATRRLVALRASRTLREAAERLGMAPVSLSRWIGRRRMPMKIVE